MLSAGRWKFVNVTWFPVRTGAESKLKLERKTDPTRFIHRSARLFEGIISLPSSVTVKVYSAFVFWVKVFGEVSLWKSLDGAFKFLRVANRRLKTNSRADKDSWQTRRETVVCFVEK